VSVRRLGPDDAPAFAALRLAGLRERPDAFGSSPEADLVNDAARVRELLSPEREDAVFGAFDETGGDSTLVGVAGVQRHTGPKARHHATIWGMYVAPHARTRGLGGAVLDAAVAYAESLAGVEWLRLGVGVHNTAAQALYQRRGFAPWAVERDALRVAGEPVDELRMQLRLPRARAEVASASGAQAPDAAATQPRAQKLTGHCLCEGVRFEVGEVRGPLELCHCPRCRRVSGSAFVAGLVVSTAGYRMTAGRELVRRFALPLREAPPPYTTFFCSRCGSPVPDPAPEGEAFEIPAGLLEGDAGVSATRHIFVEHRAGWYDPHAVLPELDRAAVLRLRGARRPRGDGAA